MKDFHLSEVPELDEIYMDIDPAHEKLFGL